MSPTLAVLGVRVSLISSLVPGVSLLVSTLLVPYVVLAMTGFPLLDVELEMECCEWLF